MTVTQYGIWNTLGGQSAAALSSSIVGLGSQATVAHSSALANMTLTSEQAQALAAAQQQAIVSGVNQYGQAMVETITFASTGTVGVNPYTAPPTYGTAPSTEAVHRSMELLYDWMNPEQRRMWATRNYFDVIGGDSGRRYRIYPPMPFNIHRLAKDSDEPDWKICFEPKDKKLPKGDILLCQKLALELDERDTLEIANQQVYHAW